MGKEEAKGTEEAKGQASSATQMEKGDGPAVRRQRDQRGEQTKAPTKRTDAAVNEQMGKGDGPAEQ